MKKIIASIFLCMTITQLSFSSDLKHRINPGRKIIWHPLICAIQHANINEVKDIMNTIGKDDIMFTGYITPLAIAQSHAQQKKYHPTTRQTYYQICDILEQHGVQSSWKVEPMEPLIIMIEEHYAYHADLVKATQLNIFHDGKIKKHSKLGSKNYD